MQTNRLRFRSVKEISFDCILNHFSKLLPRVTLRHNRLCQTLGNICAVGILCDTEHKLAWRSYSLAHTIENSTRRKDLQFLYRCYDSGALNIHRKDFIADEIGRASCRERV